MNIWRTGDDDQITVQIEDGSLAPSVSVALSLITYNLALDLDPSEWVSHGALMVAHGMCVREIERRCINRPLSLTHRPATCMSADAVTHLCYRYLHGLVAETELETIWVDNRDRRWCWRRPSKKARRLYSPDYSEWLAVNLESAAASAPEQAT